MPAQKRSKPKKLAPCMVPLIGVEPIRYHYHRILSPARLPISPRRHAVDQISGIPLSFPASYGKISLIANTVRIA